MYRAMIAKDIPALSAVLDDSFVLVHMTGMRQPKAAFLKAVANGTLNYSSAEHDSMDVTVQGNTATLIGKSRVHAAVFGGGCARLGRCAFKLPEQEEKRIATNFIR